MHVTYRDIKLNRDCGHVDIVRYHSYVMKETQVTHIAHSLHSVLLVPKVIPPACPLEGNMIRQRKQSNATIDGDLKRWKFMIVASKAIARRRQT